MESKTALNDYAILVLAAGASNRMGRSKQLLPWGDDTLLGHTLGQVRNVGIRRKYLLLGSRAEQIISEVDITGFIPMVYAGWEEGMGSGIAYAVGNMLNDLPKLKGIMLTLADQPEVDAMLLSDMLRVHGDSEKPLLACAYGERSGVPAIITGEYLQHLLQLQGDRGARGLFQTFPDRLERYLLQTPLTDVDDPETYRRHHFESFRRYPLF